MPVGPSHGGGFSDGSSHSGGGFSSGGGSFRSNLAGALLTAAIVSDFSRNGRKITKKESVKRSCIAGIVIAVIIALVGVILLMSGIGTQKKMAQMAQDAKEYQEIIEKAQNGDAGYYTLTITNIHKKFSSSNYEVYYLGGDYSFDCTARYYTTANDIDYYYLDYSFNDGVHGTISAQTYACYSQSAVQGLSELTLAYTKEYDADGSWDVIPTDYSLEKNMEYNQGSSGIALGIIFIVVSAVIIVASIAIKKKYDKMPEEPEETEDQSNSALKEKPKDAKICAYCGSVVDKSASNCPSCGSTKFK